MPDFGVFDPILVHEKMGEDGRPNLWFLGGRYTSKVPNFGVFDPIFVMEKVGEDGRPNWGGVDGKTHLRIA